MAQIARSIARALGLDEDLAEAVALAHDLGHPPFGHAGEEALDGRWRPIGGFDHNAQTFRVVTRLERRYAEFDGLNLTWETLEGIVKHNGPLDGRRRAKAARGVPASIADYSAEARISSSRAGRAPKPRSPRSPTTSPTTTMTSTTACAPASSRWRIWRPFR